MSTSGKADSFPRVRVFVPTYRRATLLARALESLRAQTLTDWVCEVHNDDPNDVAPAALVTELKDSRIKLVTHARNLGPVETFNLFFSAAKEPYYSLLEDDNWWDPHFLRTMVDALERHPHVAIAWCNQKIWQETPGGLWQDTGQTVNEIQAGPPILMAWGSAPQAMGALHANGAMLVRSRPGDSFPVHGVPFTGIEAIRERLLPHPLLYLPEPLAFFALTQSSARNRDLPVWLAFQTALLATFVKHAHLDERGRAALWRHYRGKQMPPSTAFLCAGLVCKECRAFLREATLTEWCRMIRSAFRRPFAWWRAIRVRHYFPEWWHQLDRATAARFAASRETTGASPQTAPTL